jgi:hypothetical protein
VTKVSETKSYHIPGLYEPEEYTVTHTICDACGSSDIGEVGSHLSRSVDGVFTLVILASFYGAVIVGLVTHDLTLCGGIGMISVIAGVAYLVLTRYVERNNHLKCNQCGNQHIT